MLLHSDSVNFIELAEGKKQILSSISMEGIAEYIKDKAKNIIVMCGAGISTSAGVPDFRTPGSHFLWFY